MVCLYRFFVGEKSSSICGTILQPIGKTPCMIKYLQKIGIVQQESNSPFKPVPALLIMVLMLTFVGTTLYILINSLSTSY